MIVTPNPNPVASDDDDDNATDMYNEDDWKNLRLMKELFVMTEDPWLRAIKAAKGLYDPKADEEQEVDEGQTDFHIDAEGMKFQKIWLF